MDAKRHKETEGRNSPTRILYFYQIDGSVLLKTTIIILLLIPSLCISCSREITEYESAEGLHKCFLAFTKVQTPVEDYSTEILIYDPDKGMELDTYQVGMRLSEKMDIICTKGKKKLVVIARPGEIALEDGENTLMEEIGTYQAIRKRTYSLKDEDPTAPTLAGEADLEGGLATGIRMRTNLNMIKVNEIRKDFSGLPFEDSPIENVKIYIINAVEDYPYLGSDEQTRTSSYINKGKLSEKDLREMSHPEMLVHKGNYLIGSEKIRADARLYCFPNHCRKEDMGNVFTRLVIEGEIEGVRWYWPVNLNFTDDDAKETNCREYDITITGTGSSDPDIAVSSVQARIRCRITDWTIENEKDILY